MSISVTTNVATLRALNSLRMAANSTAESLRHTTTGYKLNQAADSPSDMGINTVMTSRINGNTVALANAQDTMNLLDTADAAMEEMTMDLLRIRDLLVRAANGATLTGEDQAKLILEADTLRTELGRIAQSTTFNTKLILFGDLDSTVGAVAQIGADGGSGFRLSVVIPQMQTAINGFLAQPPPPNPLANLTLQAQSGLSQADVDLSTLAGIRSGLGSLRNRLSHIVSDLTAENINQSSARSHIADTHYASELANFTKLQILTQSTLATLAQANSTPQVALQLLQ